MSQKCPANLVKSIFLNLPDVVSDLQLHPWLAAVRSHEQKFGFSNFHCHFTAWFHCTIIVGQKSRKKFSIGDFVVVSSTYFAAQVYLLKKQEVGWKTCRTSNRTTFLHVSWGICLMPFSLHSQGIWLPHLYTGVLIFQAFGYPSWFFRDFLSLCFAMMVYFASQRSRVA